MKRIHWCHIILLVLYAGGCASDGMFDEGQHSVVKKSHTESGIGTKGGEPHPPQAMVPQLIVDHPRILPIPSNRQTSELLTPSEQNSAADALEQVNLLSEGDVSEIDVEEMSKISGREKYSFPIVGDVVEEEILYERAGKGLSEDTSSTPSGMDSKLTSNSETMLPSPGTESVWGSQEQKSHAADSRGDRNSRDPNRLKTSEDLLPQSSAETESFETLVARGRAYLTIGEPELAYAQFDRLVGLSNKALSYYYRGYASMKLHRYKKAVSDFSQAIQKNPDNTIVQHQDHSPFVLQTLRNSYRERAFAYFQLQQPQLALADITKFLEMSAGHQIGLTEEYVLRGRVYTALDRTDLAITDFSEALRFHLPSQSQAYIYYLRGLSFFRIKKVQLGLQDMDQSCRLQLEKACGFFGQIQ